MRKKRLSLAQFVAAGYVISIILILLLAYFFVELAFSLLSEENDLPVKNWEALELALEHEDYLIIKNDLYKGQGSFVITDEDGRVVFSGGESLKKGFSRDELKYIPEIGSDDYFDWDSVGSEDNKYYLLTHYGLDETEDFYRLKDFVVLDKNGNVLESSSDTTEKTFSKELMKSSVYIENEDYLSLQKQSFTTRKGEKRIFIFQMKRPASDNGYARNALLLLVSLFTALVLMITILFGWLVSRSVRKPLKVLDDAMNQLSAGEDYPELEEGDAPAEFSKAMDTFRQMARRLSESETQRLKLEENRKKMLSDISHDLKTPVTVIAGYADALVNGMIQKEDAPKYLNAIRQKSEILAELVNSFYEYSRLEDPRFSLVLKRGDICEYFRAYLANKYSELELSGYEMEVELPDKVVYMDFDESQLKRAFENILSNTIKHNEPGICVYAGLFVEEEDAAVSKICIRLGDNGDGIPDALRERIFEPFVVGE